MMNAAGYAMSDAAAPSLLIQMGTVEPVQVAADGSWSCAYCSSTNNARWFVTGTPRTQWSRSGMTVVDHLPECPWLAVSRWWEARQQL